MNNNRKNIPHLLVFSNLEKIKCRHEPIPQQNRKHISQKKKKQVNMKLSEDFHTSMPSSRHAPRTIFSLFGRFSKPDSSGFGSKNRGYKPSNNGESSYLFLKKTPMVRFQNQFSIIHAYVDEHLKEITQLISLSSYRTKESRSVYICAKNFTHPKLNHPLDYFLNRLTTAIKSGNLICRNYFKFCKKTQWSDRCQQMQN